MDFITCNSNATMRLQQTIYQDARNELLRGNNICIISPTGIGKTIALNQLYWNLMSINFLMSEKNVCDVLFVRENKYNPTVSTSSLINLYRAANPACWDYAQKMGYDFRNNNITYQKLLSMLKNINSGGISAEDDCKFLDGIRYIIFDESHKIGTTEFRRYFEQWYNQQKGVVRIVGASPFEYRTQKGLTYDERDYCSIVDYDKNVAITLSKCLEQGILPKPIIIRLMQDNESKQNIRSFLDVLTNSAIQANCGGNSKTVEQVKRKHAADIIVEKNDIIEFINNADLDVAHHKNGGYWRDGGQVLKVLIASPHNTEKSFSGTHEFSEKDMNKCIENTKQVLTKWFDANKTNKDGKITFKHWSIFCKDGQTVAEREKAIEDFASTDSIDPSNPVKPGDLEVKILCGINMISTGIHAEPDMMFIYRHTQAIQFITQLLGRVLQSHYTKQPVVFDLVDTISSVRCLQVKSNKTEVHGKRNGASDKAWTNGGISASDISALSNCYVYDVVKEVQKYLGSINNVLALVPLAYQTPIQNMFLDEFPRYTTKPVTRKQLDAFCDSIIELIDKNMFIGGQVEELDFSRLRLFLIDRFRDFFASDVVA